MTVSISNNQNERLSASFLDMQRFEQEQEVRRREEKKDKDPAQPADPLLLAYMMIYSSVIVSSNSAAIDSKALQVNANIQDNLIRQEQAFGFSVINTFEIDKDCLAEFKNVAPSAYAMLEMFFLKNSQIPQSKKDQLYSAIEKDPKVLQLVLDEKQMKNNSIESIRGTFEDKLNVAKQTAQVMETNTNTVINETGTDIQKGSSIMQMLLSITNQIGAI